MMKKLFVLLSIIALLNIKIASAETYDSYIVKYLNEDVGQVIGAEEYAEFARGDFKLASNEIEYVEPNYDVELFSDESIDNISWNVKMINASIGWDYSCYGNGIKIAVIDSGIDLEYINCEIADAYDFTSSDSHDNVMDNVGHGTFVTGIIASDCQDYCRGIASQAIIVPIKCFDNNYTTKSNVIAAAIRYAVDVCECDIINMSFGLKENSKYIESAVEYAVSKNVLLTAAVGNYGSSTLYYPAAYDDVIGVGAVDEDMNCCSFSQKNDSVYVSAPGNHVPSIQVDGYDENSGTSFATPHVTATIAIALNLKNNMTPSDVQLLLKDTSKDMGESGYDNCYGYGIVDIEAICNQLLYEDVFISPFDTISKTITVYNTSKNNISFSLIDRLLYDDMLSIEEHRMTLFTDDKEKIYIEDMRGTEHSFYAWNNLNLMEPLCNKRVFEVK